MDTMVDVVVVKFWIVISLCIMYSVVGENAMHALFGYEG